MLLQEKSLFQHEWSIVGSKEVWVSSDSNWTVSTAEGVEFSFISQTSPSKIKYQVLHFFFS